MWKYIITGNRARGRLFVIQKTLSNEHQWKVAETYSNINREASSKTCEQKRRNSIQETFLFFFLFNLVRELSILLIFSKNQLLSSLIFSIIILFPVSLISALFFSSSVRLHFSSFLSCNFSLLILDLFFQIYTFITTIFP